MKHLALLVLMAAATAPAVEVFVSPTGDDTGGDGSRERPFATLHRARDAIREQRRAAPSPDASIVLLPGGYHLTAPLQLDHRDSGLTLRAESNLAARLYGGPRLDAWQVESNGLWSAPAPSLGSNAPPLRTLIVNGRRAERARWPAEGSLRHRSRFDVRWLSSVAGGWERPPTADELTRLIYDPADLLPSADLRHAEVRVYHMWDDSLVGVASNDTSRSALILSPPPKSPAGAFGVRRYVLFNVPDGLSHPGAWYWDRSAGRLLYRPRPGEDPTRTPAVIATLTTLIRVAGTPTQPVERLTLRGLALRATTSPPQPAGFGAYNLPGAIELLHARHCRLDGLDLAALGGYAIVGWSLHDSQVVGCRIEDIGGGGLRLGGAGGLVASNHIARVGLDHAGAVPISVTHVATPSRTNGFRVARNVISDAPYSGIILGGGDHVVEENFIERVMRDLHDGAAIYGGVKRTVIRRNVVRDVVAVGEGYGVSAYYLDEGAEGCVVERNVSIGVERPTHNHMTLRNTIRDNLFIAHSNMVLSFARSARCEFTGNTLVVPGALRVWPPNAISRWEGNFIVRGGPPHLSLESDMPPATPPAPRSAPIDVPRAASPPQLDGTWTPTNWPGRPVSLDRDCDRWPAPGAPAFALLAWDDDALYIAVQVVAFSASHVRTGSVWRADDGVELALAGRTAEGREIVRTLRGFAGGAVTIEPVEGEPSGAPHPIRYAAALRTSRPAGWSCTWAIPWRWLGIPPGTNVTLAANICVWRSEDETHLCLEGSPGADAQRIEAAARWRLR